MADTLNTLKTRRSCRAYTSEHVEEEKLNAIIEAGTYAATGMGKQSPIILVIKDPAVHEQLRKLNAAAMGMDIDPFYGAPNLLVVFANKDIPTYIYDGSLVMGNMMNMIIGRLVERIDVEEGNKITIKYRVSFEQFMNKEQASA